MTERKYMERVMKLLRGLLGERIVGYLRHKKRHKRSL